MLLALLALAANLMLGGEQAVLQQIEQLDRALVAAEARLTDVTTQKEGLARQLAETEATLGAAQVRRQAARQAFRRRLRGLAKMPVGARAALFGTMSGFEDFLVTQRTLRWLARHDRKLEGFYRQTGEELGAARQALLAQQARLEELDSQARQERDTIAAKRAARAEFLNAGMRQPQWVQQTGREQGAAEAALTTAVRHLATMVARRPLAAFTQNKGRLPWPAAGTVLTSFGQRLELAFGTLTIHNGLAIKAPSGAAVTAIAAGRVVYADWLHGYGQVIILDHGEQYHSLVAHLGRISVALGQEVEQGQPIGTVGDSGSLRGTQLYLEVRHKGMPVDPRAWLRPQP